MATAKPVPPPGASASGAPDIHAALAGNHLRLITRGMALRDALIALIDGARSSLKLYYYIFAADESGTLVRDALIAAAGIFSVFPRISIPQADDLNKGTPRQMIARTELWLEAQRPALPPPAVGLVDDLGVKLDLLGQQLETAPASHDSIRDIRELVGETLPEMVQSYTRVPAAMRSEQHAGATADERLVEGLAKISDEIDSINRKIADGALDDLAVQHRYLGYRYGDGPASEPTGEGAPN